MQFSTLNESSLHKSLKIIYSEIYDGQTEVKKYHVTFEPLFDDPGKVDLTGIDWIVVGTMTGAKSRTVKTDPGWGYSLTEQAHELNIPVFWKEDLVPIMGEEMIQEMPDAFNKVLEEQRIWNNQKSK